MPNVNRWPVKVWKFEQVQTRDTARVHCFKPFVMQMHVSNDLFNESDFPIIFFPYHLIQS
jgi:hypothetical protein